MIELAARKELSELRHGDRILYSEQSSDCYQQIGVIIHHVPGAGFIARFPAGEERIVIYKYAEVV